MQTEYLNEYLLPRQGYGLYTGSKWNNHVNELFIYVTISVFGPYNMYFGHETSTGGYYTTLLLYSRSNQFLFYALYQLNMIYTDIKCGKFIWFNLLLLLILLPYMYNVWSIMYLHISFIILPQIKRLLYMYKALITYISHVI